MNYCDEIHDKIVFFDDLDEAEQREVKLHTSSCSRCRKKLHEFQAIMSSLKNSQDAHGIDDELIVRYSIHLSDPEEPDYDGRKLTRSEIKTIREHLAECDQCQKKVEQLCQEYQDIEAYFEKADFPALMAVSPSLSEKALALFGTATDSLKAAADSIKSKIFAPIPKYYPIAAGALAVLLITIWVGPFFRGSKNPYLELASLQQEKISSLTRGGAPQSLSEGLSAFHAGDYQQAIENLELSVSENSEDAALFYGHYALGISYLLEARSDLFGRFQKVDADLVEKGIRNLQIARRLTDNSGIDEDCQWYIAKAHLMLRDGEKAKNLFGKIVGLRGRRYREAQQMVKDLNKILISQ